MGVLILRAKPTPKQIKEMGEHFGSYIKVVADLDRKIISGGGEYHVDGEQLLLADGSKQPDLWGGGYDVTAKEADSLALINKRPNHGNSDMAIQDPNTRQKFFEVVKMFFDVRSTS